ncbi:MAG: hypothetical protein L6R36_004709 [Xanthoria steineri]|nr:MAG: hypothetical protein L6R36_004709 [Xanthoria steineri]
MKAHKEALKHQEEDIAAIEKAKKIKEAEYGILNAINVEEAEELYGTYDFSAIYVATHAEKWVLGEWVPELVKKHGIMEIKSKDTTKRMFLRDVACCRFFEWVWFPANDYAKIAWYIPLVRYHRARTFANANPQTRAVLLRQIKEHPPQQRIQKAPVSPSSGICFYTPALLKIFQPLSHLKVDIKLYEIGVSPTQDTADYEESKGKRGYQHPWGQDEVADTAHGDLYKLLSGVKDPEGEPSKAFDDLKAHLMRAIAPYDLDKVAPVDKERAKLYNGIHERFVEQDYSYCLDFCDELKNKRQDKLSFWREVRAWKVGIMRAMILPFEDAEVNILKACDFGSDTAMFEAILKAIYDGEVPNQVGKTTIRDNIIRAEHVRIIRRFRQRNYGEAEEKEDRMRTKTNLVENSDDIMEVDKVGGFVPVNEELSEYAQKRCIT